MYKRIIVKIGTTVLSKNDGSLDKEVLESIVLQVSALKKSGVEIVLVTSGAVGTGKGLLTPRELLPEVVQKQVFAAVGQVKLMQTYAGLFSTEGYVCAQVLVTKEDFRDQEHFSNMKNCLEGLIHEHIVPVINENDVVATTELMFTDNDELAGLVAEQLHADALIILSSVEGVLAKDSGAVIPEIDFSHVAEFEKHVTPNTSTGGRGGMVSKYAVAKTAVQSGIAVHIASGKKRDVLSAILAGEAVGTTFIPA